MKKFLSFMYWADRNGRIAVISGVLAVQESTSAIKEFQYYVNRGDSKGAALGQINGRLVKAWVEFGPTPTVYQLDSDGQRMIDYTERRDQLRGEPGMVATYIGIASFIFCAISLVRLRKWKKLPDTMR